MAVESRKALCAKINSMQCVHAQEQNYMPRRERMRYRFKETPEPLKPLTTAVIQLIAGALLWSPWCSLLNMPLIHECSCLTFYFAKPLATARLNAQSNRTVNPNQSPTRLYTSTPKLRLLATCKMINIAQPMSPNTKAGRETCLW